MSFSLLLPESCRVLRRSEPTVRNGRVVDAVVTEVAASVPCRRDFTYMQQSRMEPMPDQNLEREVGTLFVGPSMPIQPQDIVVFSDGKQYDVYTTEPIWGYGSVHHYECEIRSKAHEAAV